VSASGAPKKILGMKSMNVWVIAIATRKIRRMIGDVILRRNAEIERSNAPTRFMWIPGVSPVIVPARIPKVIAISSSRSIVFENFMNIKSYIASLCRYFYAEATIQVQKLSI